MHALYATFWQKVRFLSSFSQEVVIAFYIDKNFQELATCFLGTGNRDSCTVHPRDIFRIAVQMNAFAVILAHTHPSGSLEPSPEDILATHAMSKAGKELRIPMLGHLIVTEHGWHCIDSS